MAIFTEEIDNYKVTHYSNDNTYGQTAVITLYQGTRYKAALYFIKEGSSIPQTRRNSFGYLYIYYRDFQFQEVITTLREEDPIYVGFNDRINWGWISTTNEPVGEEES